MSVHKIKSHKSVEQIAKKHRLEVSFIEKQLKMGIPIEHEHTKNKDLSTDIALQHLDEIPDYYTRLKKMESDAKKNHKKFKDVNIKEEGLRDWFGKSKSKGGKPGWVDVVDGDACAREEGETATPKCVSSKKRASMSKQERLAAQAAKRREDPNQPQKYGSAKPTMVKTDRKIRKEEMYLQEVKDKPDKGSGKKDACYHKVKSRYDVWPSAYASGALVKCRKVGASNWGTKSEACWDGYEQKGMKKKGKKTVPNCVPVKEESGVRYCPKCAKAETRSECKYGPKYWDMFSMPIKLKDYTPNTPHPGNFPESYDHEHSMARSEISTIISAAKRLRKKMKGEGNIEAWVQSKITKAADYLDSAADYVDSGEMKAEEYSNWRTEFGLSEDWQKVNRQDKTDGLSKKAVDTYRRENPGSKLQTAVTEKNPKGKRAKRRASFCRRSAGQRDMHNIDCSKTPDKPICKARRRWKC